MHTKHAQQFAFHTPLTRFAIKPRATQEWWQDASGRFEAAPSSLHLCFNYHNSTIELGGRRIIRACNSVAACSAARLCANLHQGLHSIIEYYFNITIQGLSLAGQKTEQTLVPCSTSGFLYGMFWVHVVAPVKITIFKSAIGTQASRLQFAILHDEAAIDLRHVDLPDPY